MRIRADQELTADAMNPLRGRWRYLRRQCAECRVRQARFRFRGTVRADRSHTLCFRCFRALNDRLRLSRGVMRP